MMKRKILPCLFLLMTCLSSISFAGMYDGDDIVGIESIVNSVENQTEQWRIDGDLRIDQHRKANIEIRVVDQSGLPVSGVPVSIKLKCHKFEFGGVAAAATIVRGNSSITKELYRSTYLNMGFNAGGFVNAFKAKLTGLHQYIPDAMDWFAQNNIPLRGHTLIWPGHNDGSHLSATVKSAWQLYVSDPTAANKQNLYDVAANEVADWASSWDVFEWDVINEPRGNHLLQDILGDHVMVDWFNIAKQNIVNPNAGLLLNENSVISNTDRSAVMVGAIQTYMDTLDFLLANNAPVTALGFQSRFKKADTTAEMIYQRLQLFEKYNLPIVATEMEMKTTDSLPDDYSKAVMTEKVMSTYFSHHLVRGIYAWTIFPWDGRELVNTDGSPNLRGKVWLYLAKKRWMTDEALTSDVSGLAFVRGFKGDYEITVGHPGQEVTIDVQVDNDVSLNLSITGAVCPDNYPDLTGDCRVDIDDISMLAEHWLDCGWDIPQRCND